MRSALPFDFRSLLSGQTDPAQLPRLLVDGTLVNADAHPGRAAVILSRGLCRLRHVALAHVPSAQKPAALHNQLLAWSPFDQSAFSVAAQGGGYLVIAWDEAVVESALRAAGWPIDVALRCEATLHPPMRSGVRLMVCLEGYEAQCWTDGRLLRSRWWPHLPDDSQWALFLRGGPDARTEAGLSTSRPEPATVAWLARPWLDFRAPADLARIGSKWERLAVSAVSLGLLALSAAQAHLALDAYRAEQRAGEALAALHQATAPVLRMRDHALAQQADARKLAAEMTGVLPLELLAHLDEVLPRKGVVLREIDLNGLKLRLDLELGPYVSRSEIVAALRQSAWMTEITEAKDAIARSTVPFDLKLRAARPPPRPAVRVLAPGSALTPASSSALRR